MFDKNIFCERLKTERLKIKKTQAQVGEATGCYKQRISRYEKGEQEPPLATLVALADYFDVSLDYLVGRSDISERR